MIKNIIISRLIKKGVSFQNGYETKQQVFDSLSELFVIEDYDIKTNSIEFRPNSKYPSDSYCDIPWHQENYFKDRRPEYLAFWCEKSGSKEEYTGLLDSDYFLNKIDSKLAELESFKIRFKRVRGESYSKWFSLVEIHDGFKGLRFAWQDSRFRKVEINSDKNIINSIQGYLSKFEYQKFEPDAGSLVIFNNLRFLHKRGRLKNNTKRKLVRFLIYKKKDTH